MAWLVAAALLLATKGSEASKSATFPGPPLAEGEYLPSIQTGYTCEGEELEVACGEGELIQIIRANYGRFSIAICNEEGRTHWSVNCMSPRTRHILQNRCDRLNSCRLPVSSDLFGDPCPGTHKYVEIHYTCSPATYSDQTGQQRPPWYIQPNNNTFPWLKDAAAARSDLPPKSGGSSGAAVAAPRIPILVATTTSTPKRIPITTPPPPTTTTMTTTLVQSSTAAVVGEMSSLNQAIGRNSTLGEAAAAGSDRTIAGEAMDSGDEEDEAKELVEGSLVDMRGEEGAVAAAEEEDGDFCRPSLARNLYWQQTRRGQSLVQPCPNGATGLARWACSHHQSGQWWATVQPDMSDCKSAAMTNLEVKVRQEDPENVIASSLAHLTGSRKLYGGDLESAVSVMRTVASRIQFLLQQGPGRFYKKEAYIQEVLLNIVRSGSNLLDAKNREAWADLEAGPQLRLASSLLLALQENAQLFAEVTAQPEILIESSYNILMAISVLNLRSLRANGTSFPLSSYEEPYGTIEDRVLLPRQLLESETGTADGLAKVVFFSFKHLDDILAQFFQQRGMSASTPSRVLNSRVISAAVVRGAMPGATVAAPPPAHVVLRHLREEGVAAPTCVIWDTAAAAWSEAGCRVVAARARDTVCECHLRQGVSGAAHFGLLMEVVGGDEVGLGSSGGLVTTVVQLPAFHVEIIVASVAAGVLLILLLLLLKFRGLVCRWLGRSSLSSCCGSGSGKKKCSAKLESCSKSQSFFAGINLVQATAAGSSCGASVAGSRAGGHGAGGEKSQTLSTTLPDSAQMSQYLIHQVDHNGDVLMAAPDGQYDLDLNPTQQQAATLRLRAPLPPHLTLNPYSTQLVDNINRMMSGQQQQQLYTGTSQQQQQLLHLTNTLKKKKCLGGHPGPCHHNHTTSNRSHISFTPDAMSVRSSSDSTRSEPDTETDFVPAATTTAGDVVFRAVSPHGHVYWEIDPKRPNKLAAAGTESAAAGGQHQLLLLQHNNNNSDSDTNNDAHNLSDFSEEEGTRVKAILLSGGGGDHSGRHSASSRFSDHRPLISTHSSPGSAHQLQQQQQLNSLPDSVLAAILAQQQQQQQLIQFSPHRFSSLQKAQAQQGFSTRTRLRAHGTAGRQQQQLRGSFETVGQEAAIPEQVQQQVTIPDLRRIPVSVKSSEYIMAKIQSHMDQRNNSQQQRNNTLRERQV